MLLFTGLLSAGLSGGGEAGTAREEARQRLIRAATITTLQRLGQALGDAQLPGYTINAAATPDKYRNGDSLLTWTGKS